MAYRHCLVEYQVVEGVGHRLPSFLREGECRGTSLHVADDGGSLPHVEHRQFTGEEDVDAGDDLGGLLALPHVDGDGVAVHVGGGVQHACFAVGGDGVGHGGGKQREDVGAEHVTAVGHPEGGDAEAHVVVCSLSESCRLVVGSGCHHRCHHGGSRGIGVVGGVEVGKHPFCQTLAAVEYGGGTIEPRGEGGGDGQRHVAALLVVLRQRDVVEQVVGADDGIVVGGIVPQCVVGVAVAYHAEGVAHGSEGVHGFSILVEGVQTEWRVGIGPCVGMCRAVGCHA